MSAELVEVARGSSDEPPLILVRGYMNRGAGRERFAWIRAVRLAGHRGRIFELTWDASSPYRFASNVIGFRDWRNVKGRAKRLGRAVLPARLNDLEWDGVTLLGASAGARIVYHALLSEGLRAGKVRHVILLGGAMKRDGDKDWDRAVEGISGKLINVFSSADAVLSTLYRAASGGGHACGTGPIESDHRRIVNVDATDLVRGGFLNLLAHGRYTRALALRVKAEMKDVGALGRGVVSTRRIASRRANGSRDSFWPSH